MPFGETGKLSGLLRRENPPIFTRVHEDRVVLDLRTILNRHEENAIVASLTRILQKGAS